MLDRLRKEDFVPLLGDKLKVCAGNSETELEVKEVVSLAAPSPRAAAPFYVVLRSRDGWRAAQGMFRIEHPELGALELFTVPIGPDGEGLCYQIIFN